MTRRLYTLAYPKLTLADRQMIDDFRANYDSPYKDVVAPHFTIGFGCSDINDESYLSHVEAIARRAAPIAFHCRYAMLGTDDNSSVAYVFLVPDQGNSAISLLHDQLYTGTLASKLRLDLEFIPHITIGTQANKATAKEHCDQLNATGISIPGSIDALTVGALNGRIEDLATFAFQG